MPSLTPTARHFSWGTLLILDLDRMSDLVAERGWSEYKPNPLTGLLSNLVEDLVRKHGFVVIYGLDWERGTEEAVLEAPGLAPEEVRDDLIRIASCIRSEGGSITIVALWSPVLGSPARTRREAYSGYRRRAKRILERLKRRGGGVVYLDGEEIRV